MEVEQIEKPKRRVLSLKKEPEPPHDNGSPPPSFIPADESYYMVWRKGGGMPTRVYRAGQRNLAETHAKQLAAKEGVRFYVLRTFRGFEPEVEGHD